MNLSEKKDLRMINELITIKIMNTIFQDAKWNVSAQAKMIYQCVLNYWFSDKEKNLGNFAEFEMSKEALKYDNFTDEFVKLERAGLVLSSTANVKFLDVWTRHLNISEITSKKYKIMKAGEVKDEMYNSHALSDIIRMKYRLTIKQSHQLLELFFTEQDAIQTTYTNESQIRKHFIYWCQHNVDKVPSEQVKSKSKILGKTNT